MRCSLAKRRARHRAGFRLTAIACLTGAALALDHAARNVPPMLRGAQDLGHAAAVAAIGAAVLAAVAVLVIGTWAALRRGRRAGRLPGLPDEAPGLAEPEMPVPQPEPAAGPVPRRLPGRPLFISGPVRGSTVAEGAADQEAAR